MGWAERGGSCDIATDFDLRRGGGQKHSLDFKFHKTMEMVSDLGPGLGIATTAACFGCRSDLRCGIVAIRKSWCLRSLRRGDAFLSRNGGEDFRLGGAATTNSGSALLAFAYRGAAPENSSAISGTERGCF